MARLSAEVPPACLDEEILAIHLIDLAEIQIDSLDLGREERARAEGELHGVFELCQDDDVLMLFDMAEPADAAVAGGSELYQVLGVADQRIEAWFEPFGYSIPTGHLDDAA